MDTSEETEDQLIEYAIQMSIQETCKPYLTPIERLEVGSKENGELLAAIERGEEATLNRLRRFTSAYYEVDSKGCLPLHRAASLPSIQVLQAVISGSCKLSMEEKNLEGDSVLILAIKAGLVENVKVLLENGASPHTVNSKNESPLLLAVRRRSSQIVSTLVERGTFVEQLCLKRWTAVHEAAKVGCDDIMRILLRNGGNVMERDVHGVTPLGIAAEYGHARVLEILIQNGADVNAKAPNGDTILYDAAGSGNVDCIDLLLLHGANPNVANLSSLLPIHRAAREGHYQALKKCIPITTKRAIRHSGQSPVHSAADGGHAQCLNLLIESGFDVNAVLEEHVSVNYADMRKTPLYFAVSNGDVVCTKVLLDAGAKPEKDPLCCLMVAVRAGRYEIVRLLLAKQADVNCYFTPILDTVFPTALQYCLRDEMMIRLLLNSGYDAEKCFCCNHDNTGHTHCHWNDWNREMCEMCSREEKIPFCDFISVSSMMHLAGSLIRLLLDYVTHVPICSKLKMILEKQKDWMDICAILGNPRPLKHLCRLVIRRQMSFKRLNDPRVMDSSPFPSRIKDYLLYQEYDLYGRNAYVPM